MKRYDEEFKKEIIGKNMGGASIAGLSRKSGVAEQTLHKWKSEIVRNEDGEADKEKPQSDLSHIPTATATRF